MLVRCTGRPNGSRGTIGGGVRTLIATYAAPLSLRSVAISAPLFPAPTTSTRCAGVRRRVRVRDRMREPARVGLASRPRRNDRLPILSGRDHGHATAPRITADHLDGPSARRGVRGRIALHGRTGDDPQPEVAGILVEIRHDVVARQIRRIATGMGKCARPEKRRTVWRWSRSYRRAHVPPSARSCSSTTASMPRRVSAAAAESPDAPPPTTTTVDSGTSTAGPTLWAAERCAGTASAPSTPRDTSPWPRRRSPPAG